MARNLEIPTDQGMAIVELFEALLMLTPVPLIDDQNQRADARQQQLIAELQGANDKLSQIIVLLTPP